MRKYLLPNSVAILLSVALLLTGCQFQLLPPAGSVATPNKSVDKVRENAKQNSTKQLSSTQAVRATADQADSSTESEAEVVAGPEKAKPAKRATVSKEERAVNAIIEVIEAPVEESAPVGTEMQEEIQPLTVVIESVQPTAVPPTPQPTAAPSPPFVYVTGTPIHIRTGPSELYALRAVADTGATLSLIGQAEGCQWFQVQHTDFGTAWLSGSNGNVTLYNATCAQIPATN